MENDLRYPIGPFSKPRDIDDPLRKACIGEIRTLPQLLREAVSGLSHEQLDSPYRPGGWSLRQVVHHIPDSHMNGYLRCKLALTEVEPRIKTYDQDGWAMLNDSLRTPIEISLALVEALHRRWTDLLVSLDEAALGRCFQHAEEGVMSVDLAIALYAWHGRHHLAHIVSLRERMGW